MSETPRFQMVSGDQGAPVCEDGVCAVPGTEAQPLTEPASIPPTM